MQNLTGPRALALAINDDAATIPPTTEAACVGAQVHRRVWGYTAPQVVGCEELPPNTRCPIRTPGRWTLISEKSGSTGHWNAWLNHCVSWSLDEPFLSLGYDSLRVAMEAYEVASEAGHAPSRALLQCFPVN